MFTSLNVLIGKKMNLAKFESHLYQVSQSWALTRLIRRATAIVNWRIKFVGLVLILHVTERSFGRGWSSIFFVAIKTTTYATTAFYGTVPAGSYPRHTILSHFP